VASVGVKKCNAASGTASVASAGERTSDVASGAAANASARERNERCSERRGRRGVGDRTKQEILRATLLARRGKEKESCDSASGSEGKRLTGEKNKRYSERRGAHGVGRRKKVRYSNRHGRPGVGGRKNERYTERRGGQSVGKRKK
jgi:hypothetical protein